MELRVLQYFLAVAREQSISGAAESLHLSQPTLSRQLKELEEELGKQLMIRGSRRITLTEDGMLLRKRAEEIIDLVHKTESEIIDSDETIAGDIRIGSGETDGLRLLAKAARQLHAHFPQVQYHIISGDGPLVTEQLDKGLIDFGLLIGTPDLSKYDTLPFPVRDVWGVLMPNDCPLAAKDAVEPEDLWDQPLIMSRQKGAELTHWLRRSFSQLNIVATYNLLYNASLLVDEGLGYALTLDKLLNTQGTRLCFRPLKPALDIGMYLVWKKYQVFSKPAEKFLEVLQEQPEFKSQND
ncbi:LysR family transcriptional regulator [uncultured Gemmiger sp.]|uniref:LysR family transcriptional regulator n=1 Tax=uncultured Gemmiger sp. TaxID=1623490 RepID=UPI0025EAC054|nr:LysR family transcriptional regulator [uncultured Gemmiger sp.]